MDLSNKGLTLLPDLPDEVGNFNCSKNKLTNLIGAPNHVGGYFYCDHNKLTNLIGSPKKIYGDFSCSYNELTDLIGSPNQNEMNFYCDSNKLTSLYGAPKIINGYLSINGNPNLLDVSDIWDSDIGGSIYFDLNPGIAILPLIKFSNLRCKYNKLIDKIHDRNQGHQNKILLISNMI